MLKKFILTLCILGTSPSVQAQSFETCADLNGDSVLNIVDLVYWFDVFKNIKTLPIGKGDIDLRQGSTLGDYRYFAGYIFTGYPQSGCPPFAEYEIQTTTDSIIFPIIAVPDGDGSFSAPIAFMNYSDVTDLLVPFVVTGLGSGTTLDSITSPFDHSSSYTTISNTQGDRGLFLLTSFQGSLSPGRRIIARAHFSHQGSSTGTLFLSDDDISPAVRLSYMYGDPKTFTYSDLDIGVPTTLVTSEIELLLPSMIATPDSLEFSYKVGDLDPAPQFIQISSSLGSFDWTIQHNSRYIFSPAQGFAGDVISVQPKATNFNFGTTYDELRIISSGTLNSPAVVTLKMHVKPAFAANDADCDGDFDITDLVILVNYLFRNGSEPCDPFTGK